VQLAQCPYERDAITIDRCPRSREPTSASSGLPITSSTDRDAAIGCGDLRIELGSAFRSRLRYASAPARLVSPRASPALARRERARARRRRSVPQMIRHQEERTKRRSARALTPTNSFVEPDEQVWAHTGWGYPAHRPLRLTQMTSPRPRARELEVQVVSQVPGAVVSTSSPSC